MFKKILWGLWLVLVLGTQPCFSTSFGQQLIAEIGMGNISNALELLKNCDKDDVNTVSGLDMAASIDTDDYSSPLMLAITKCGGDSTLVKMLIDKGANMGYKSSKGLTAIHLAAWHRKYNVVKILLENGGKEYINKKDSYWKETPLDYAYFSPDFDCTTNPRERMDGEARAIIKILLEYGAEPDSTFFRAIRYDDVKTAKIFFKTKNAIKPNFDAVLSYLNDWGSYQHPLLFQVIYPWESCLALVKLLVENGINIYGKITIDEGFIDGKSTYTPDQWAKKHKRKDVALYLREAALEDKIMEKTAKIIEDKIEKTVLKYIESPAVLKLLCEKIDKKKRLFSELEPATKGTTDNVKKKKTIGFDPDMHLFFEARGAFL